MVIRLAKAAIVAALAAFCAHGRFNVFDYDSNYQFVRHVLSMDTIFPDSTLRSRAIDSETMWRAAYALIIAAEALCGLLLALGFHPGLRRLHSRLGSLHGRRLHLAGLGRLPGDRS